MNTNIYNINSWELSTKLLYAFGYAILVMALLLLVQPIGLIKIVVLKKKILLISFIGVNCGIFYFIQLISCRYLFEDKLTKLYQKILYNTFFILLISLISVFIISLFFPNVDILNTFNIYFASAAVISISHLIYNVVSKQIFTKKKQVVIKNNRQEEILNIKDNSTAISIPIEDIYYIKSSGNYIEIIEKNNTRPHLLRFSLKDLVNRYTDLFRCHKSFVVNITHITKITGNTKGYKIEFKELPGVTIPVSRTKGEKIIKMIS